jgi:hypothetical protein
MSSITRQFSVESTSNPFESNESYQNRNFYRKKWSFCSFNPSSPESLDKAVEWLKDYTMRYETNPVILTDFDTKIKDSNVDSDKKWITTWNNHYGGYGPGTVDIFRENMDMEKLSFENVDIAKINRQLEIDNRFNWKPMEKENQTSLSDYI